MHKSPSSPSLTLLGSRPLAYLFQLFEMSPSGKWSGGSSNTKNMRKLNCLGFQRKQYHQQNSRFIFPNELSTSEKYQKLLLVAPFG